ncbi:hypothetical protein BG006_002589, partial [Podila minutissima]
MLIIPPNKKCKAAMALPEETAVEAEGTGPADVAPVESVPALVVADERVADERGAEKPIPVEAVTETKKILPRTYDDLDYFYHHNGPISIINIWKEEEWLYWTEDIAMAAMEMGIKIISKELDRLTQDDSLQFLLNSVTLKRISKFSFKRLTETFLLKVPLCSKVLMTLAGTNKTSMRRPEIVVPVITSMLLIMCSSKSNYLQKVLS